jgi:hypothetical protein
MANHALFIGFGFPVRGREKQATQVFNEAMEMWGKLQEEGAIESFDAFFLDPHGGDLGGFFLLRGELQSLDRMRASDEFERLIVRAQLIVESVGVVHATTGAEIARGMGFFEEAVAELV